MAHRDLLDEGRPVLAEVPPLEDLQHTGRARRVSARPRHAPPRAARPLTAAPSPQPALPSFSEAGRPRPPHGSAPPSLPPSLPSFLPPSLRILREAPAGVFPAPGAPRPARHSGLLPSPRHTKSLNLIQVRAESGKSL